MELTTEQKAIIASAGNIRINAVAGSGKTTTIIEYARTRPEKSRILYLAFNKSVKLEAAKKFAKLGLSNVRVETAHSLAYKHIVMRFQYKVRALGYRATDLVDILKMRQLGERHAEYILANHVLRFAAYYCNSDALKLDDLNYRETLTEPIAKSFVNANYTFLEKYTAEFLRMMNSREIEVTHDYYLKKFQLIAPKLKYDYILFDEGQDASPAMLDVFFNQDATKVIVGDRHQQIYGWRFAVNSLEKADYATYNLSTSFRFDQNVANLAMEVLKYKEQLSSFGCAPSSFDYAQDDNAQGDHARVSTKSDQVTIVGAGRFSEIRSKAILARTNLGLLLKAIEYVTENRNAKKIYFEGNINSYTYAEDGTSLYDVLNLFLKQKSRIKDRLIRSMSDMKDLKQYIEKTGDPQLGMLVEIVEQYGDRIPGILAKIKALHVENEKREEAEVIFSTVHRCKGLEYDQIELVNDFIKEDSIQRLKSDPKKKDVLDVAKLTEEINLLYVAATRARVRIIVDTDMLPKSFTATENIGPTVGEACTEHFDCAQYKLLRSAEDETISLPSSFGYAQDDNGAGELRSVSSYHARMMRDDQDDDEEDFLFELEMEEREHRRYMERKLGYNYSGYSRARRFEELKEELEEKLRQRRQQPAVVKSHEQIVEEARKTYPQAYAPWTSELELKLKQKYESGVSIPDIAREMGRSKWAIEARLEKMGLKAA